MRTPAIALREGLFAAVLSIVLAGCVTAGGGVRGTETPAQQPAKAVTPDQQKRIDELTVGLQSAKKDLEAAREDKRRSQETSDSRVRDLEVRLKATQTAYQNAFEEVLRLRARIGTLAAEPEAAAMFAEARVIVDRMQEEAFNDTARGYLHMSQNYLKDGKMSMEEKNFGRAAYNFEMITATYQDFKKTSPQSLTVLSSSAPLRASAAVTAERTGTVEKGAVLEGIQKREGWFRVKAANGASGWIRAESVY